MRWVLRCVFAISLSIAGLSGCALFQKSAPAEVAQPAPLSAVTPAAPEPTTAMGGIYPASKVAKQAAKAAEKARIAAQKAALASKEAAVASDEASQAAKQAELAVRMSQGTPPSSKHRKKLTKRASPPVQVEEAPSPTPTAEAPTPTVASQSQIPAETSTPASSAGAVAETPSLTSPADLVSSADAAQDHSSPLDTLKVIDQAGASLKKVTRSSLGLKDAERYDLADKLLKTARDSFTKQDYVAAQSLANKAAVIIRLLPKSDGN